MYYSCCYSTIAIYVGFSFFSFRVLLLSPLLSFREELVFFFVGNRCHHPMVYIIIKILVNGFRHLKSVIFISNFLVVASIFICYLKIYNPPSVVQACTLRVEFRCDITSVKRFFSSFILYSRISMPFFFFLFFLFPFWVFSFIQFDCFVCDCHYWIYKITNDNRKEHCFISLLVDKTVLFCYEIYDVLCIRFLQLASVKCTNVRYKEWYKQSFFVLLFFIKNLLFYYFINFFFSFFCWSLVVWRKLYGHFSYFTHLFCGKFLSVFFSLSLIFYHSCFLSPSMRSLFGHEKMLWREIEVLTWKSFCWCCCVVLRLFCCRSKQNLIRISFWKFNFETS